ncbi:signal recognition particle protein [Candidatus Latescibacterota bacterium]
MFEELSEKLDVIFKKIKGQGKLTEANIRDALRDVRRAFLEADVNYRVARQFLSDVEAKALGSKVMNSITPGQLIIKIVHEELVELLGGTTIPLQLNGHPSVIMVCGLQGSGKTTSIAKLARHLRVKGMQPLVASVDVHRPAAIEQLRVLAAQNEIDFYPAGIGSKPQDIATGALYHSQEKNYDTLILDTAGRLHVDDEMMSELRDVHTTLHPNHVLFVADGMTGQDAVNAATGFMKTIPFDGIILTKVDGDTRGGAALSIRAVTGKPILFVGTGERIDAFDQFYPDRFASRILGMGDVVSFVEKAQQVIDEKKAQEFEKKMMAEGLNLADFLEQLQQIKKMGPLDQLIGMIPGIGKTLKGIQGQDQSHLKKIEAIILSMNGEERRNPSVIDGSRRKRIAAGSGTTLSDVNNVLKQFRTMQKMMKKLSSMSGQMKMMRNLNLSP